MKRKPALFLSLIMVVFATFSTTVFAQLLPNQIVNEAMYQPIENDKTLINYPSDPVAYKDWKSQNYDKTEKTGFSIANISPTSIANEFLPENILYYH
ncbi:MAG: hypothetical protein M0Z31_15605 [Clostridia bacterium]|nr:hypothetical protein [Clostridia bacterium]